LEHSDLSSREHLVKKTLFLSPPFFDRLDGGAGSRDQAQREITSWHPTWLVQPAAIVPGSKRVDAPPHNQTLEGVLKIARDDERVIRHTSTPSLANDVKCAVAIKAQKASVSVGLLGAPVAALLEQTLLENPAIEVACRHKFGALA
jgi:hypothetical protein